jgi:hypothetical protein
LLIDGDTRIAKTDIHKKFVLDMPIEIAKQAFKYVETFFKSTDTTTEHTRKLLSLVSLFQNGWDTVSEQAEMLGVTERTVKRYRAKLVEMIQTMMKSLFADPLEPETISHESFSYKLLQYAVLTGRDSVMGEYEHFGDSDMILPATDQTEVRYSVSDLFELVNMTGVDYSGSARICNTLAKTIISQYWTIAFEYWTDILESDGNLKESDNGINNGDDGPTGLDNGITTGVNQSTPSPVLLAT